MGIQSISDARSYLSRNADYGVKCPCCSQMVKVYKRNIFSTMARALILFFKCASKKLDIHEYLHISTVFGRSEIGGTFAKLSYWGLIQEKKKDPKDSHKRTSGYWRITQKGLDFVTSKCTVEKYAHTYNMSILRYSGENVTIKNCLSDDFDYEKLMRE